MTDSASGPGPEVTAVTSAPMEETRDAPTSAGPPGGPGASESTRWRYGLFAVIAAVLAILIAFVFASLRYDAADDVSTSLAAITGTLGTILGGYLGVQTGSQGKEEAEAARQKAEARAVALAAAADYDRAVQALAMVEGRPYTTRTPARDRPTISAEPPRPVGPATR